MDAHVYVRIRLATHPAAYRGEQGNRSCTETVRSGRVTEQRLNGPKEIWRILFRQQRTTAYWEEARSNGNASAAAYRIEMECFTFRHGHTSPAPNPVLPDCDGTPVFAACG
jgi:hypothetical protein